MNCLQRNDTHLKGDQGRNAGCNRNRHTTSQTTVKKTMEVCWYKDPSISQKEIFSTMAMRDPGGVLRVKCTKTNPTEPPLQA